MTEFETWLNKKATGLKKSTGMHCHFLKEKTSWKFDRMQHDFEISFSLHRHVTKTRATTHTASIDFGDIQPYLVYELPVGFEYQRIGAGEVEAA